MEADELNNGVRYRCQAEMLRAMAHPARLRLLVLLLVGPACVGELVKRTGYRQPYVSQHLAKLREAGLIEGIRDGLTVCYRISCPQTAHFLAASGMLSNQAEKPKTARAEEI